MAETTQLNNGLCSLSEIKILYPSSTYWLVANTTADVLWNSTDPVNDPQRFSVYLVNPNVPDLKQYALANNAITANHNVSVTVPNFVTRDVQQGYSIIFTNIGNISEVYSTSETFDIKPVGNTPSTYSPPTPPGSSTNNTGNSTNTGKSSDSEVISARVYLSTFFAAAVVAAMMAI
ncbi:4447_t:CDS:2 [Paraglomus occultum]|uniref:4447_t:CDS:1 n=1 Tax=Paraglomus occultum TaxID=144539 RepID=A0A9N9FK56_9GLOM|nr:4447_t:CDS:2 [Paraglomus occultum]